MTNSGTFTLISPSFNLGSVTWPTLDSKINFQIWVSKVTLSRNKLKVQIWDKVLISYVIFFQSPALVISGPISEPPLGKKRFQCRFEFSDPKLVRNHIVEFFFFKGEPKSLTSTIKSIWWSHEGPKTISRLYSNLVCNILF